VVNLYYHALPFFLYREFTPERPKRHGGSVHLLGPGAASADVATLGPAAAALPPLSLEARSETILDPSFSHHIPTPPTSPIIAASSSLPSNKRALPFSASVSEKNNNNKKRRVGNDDNESVGSEKDKKKKKMKRSGDENDPLAEFYAQARAEQDADVSSR
jgi:hypothetical protein